jgi:hypothetical protein
MRFLISSSLSFSPHVFLVSEILPVQPRTPFFESNQNLNVTVLENESVILKCAVRYKGNKTVSINRDLEGDGGEHFLQ